MRKNHSTFIAPTHFGWFLVLFLGLCITACGFHLRGTTVVSFKSLYIQGNTLSISKDLNQSIKNNGIQLRESTENAELLLDLINEKSEKRIMSLNANGVVREFELLYSVQFRTRSAGDAVWSPVQSIQMRRDFSYNDNVSLSKEIEETKLNSDMRNDAVREILRRLSAIKTNTP